MTWITVGLSAAVLLATTWSAVFLYGKLNPIIDLRLKSQWFPPTNRYVRFAFELENIGQLRVSVDKVLLAVTYDHFHQSTPASCIGSEWISFDSAERLFTTTTWISPKEVLHVERIYDAGQRGSIHVGMQVHLTYPWFLRRLGPRVKTRRQTRTYYVVNPGAFDHLDDRTLME